MGSGRVPSSGVEIRACTSPPGPATNWSVTGRDPGARSPGGVIRTRSSPPGSRTRTSGGSAAFDHTYSTEPSGRTAAPPTYPGRESSEVNVAVSRSYRYNLVRPLSNWAISRASASGYQSPVISPGRSMWSSVSVSASTSQISSSSRSCRSCCTRSRESPGRGENARAVSPLPSPSHFSATTSNPSHDTTRSAGWRESPCSECPMASSRSSRDRAATSASCSLA